MDYNGYEISLLNIYEFLIEFHVYILPSVSSVTLHSQKHERETRQPMHTMDIERKSF